MVMNRLKLVKPCEKQKAFQTKKFSKGQVVLAVSEKIKFFRNFIIPVEGAEKGVFQFPINFLEDGKDY